VHGRVASLLRIEDRDFATALEVAAGGKLYNVVVDSEETGAQLLQHANLKQRTTFIPLNKIKPNVLNDTQVQTAHKVAGKNVVTALSLVEFENEDRFVFVWFIIFYLLLLFFISFFIAKSSLWLRIH
jgi:structural maintenance of chromosome 2